MTPNFALVHIEHPYWRGLRIWLPLFLLWIPLVLLSPFILAGLVVADWILEVSVWRSSSVLWGILCALPGTDVQVRVHHKHVLVKIL